MDERRTRDEIAGDLLRAGLRPGGVVLVHSSLRSMGHVAGGPETVVCGLTDALGPDGTLLMPALSYATVHASSPAFDVARTPSCVGAITEHFRTRPGTLRSVSPTHSVCGIGRRAEELLSRHQLDDTPCGPSSPFRALRECEGQVLMLGCGLAPNTSMHAVEELVEPPYLFGAFVSYTVTHLDGTSTQMRCRRHGFEGFSQRYDRLGALLSEEELHVRTVLRATAHIIECRSLWEKGEAALRKDPFHFVDRRPAPW